MKSAIIFKAELPTAEKLQESLKELMFTPISEFSRVSYGFVPHDVTSEVITPLVETAGYAIQLRVDEKVMPKEVIKKKLDEKIEAIKAEAGENFTVGKELKAELTGEIVTDILPVALVKTTLVNAVYLEKSNLLIVNASSKKLASRLMGMLIRCIGSVTTTTVHVSSVKQGVTEKLRRYCAGQDGALEGFELGSKCSLSSAKKRKKTYDGIELEEIQSTLMKDFNDGMEVDKIQLVRNDTTFVLTNNFEFKSLDFPGVQFEPEEKEDKPFVWRRETTANCLLLEDIVLTVINSIGDHVSKMEPVEESEEDEINQEDAMYPQVVNHVKETQKCSTANIQRVFKIGFNRAARFVEKMQSEGIVSEADSRGNRTVLVK